MYELCVLALTDLVLQEVDYLMIPISDHLLKIQEMTVQLECVHLYQNAPTVMNLQPRHHPTQ